MEEGLGLELDGREGDYYHLGSVAQGMGHNESDDQQGQSLGDPNPLAPFVFLYNPDMEDISSNLQWAFWLHVYGFAFLFFFLAFYSFFSILNLRSQLSTRPYMTTINSFLCLLGTSRCAVLFIDPYGLQNRMPPVMGSLLWDLGFPSLISSFSLIQIAFLQLTQFVPQHTLCRNSPTEPFFVISKWSTKPFMMDVGPETFRKKTCLSLVITLHFMSAIISAIYSSLNSDLMLGKMVTQLLFATWGFILCGSFLLAGKRVLQILGGGSTSGAPLGSAPNDKGIANLFGMGMLAPGGGQNLASSLTAALAPTLLQSSAAVPSTTTTTTSTSKDKDTPKIKITDEHDHTVSVASASDSSRLNDIPELPEGNGNQSVPLPLSPPPVSSPRSSFSGPSDQEGGSSSSTYVRPPSPVLPRRKSSGPGLRGIGVPGSGGPRKLSWNNRRDSGGGELLGNTSSDKEVRKKSLTWCEESVERISIATEKRRASRQSFDASGVDGSSERNGGTTESLLSASVVGAGPDYTLQSILSHIAYVNQTALDYRLSRKLSRTNQVHKVVKYTSVTAALGFLVCIGELIRLLSPFGILASSVTPPSAWTWFILHTFCRFLEFAMGATVANITKQPVNRPPHYPYAMHKHHRESLYL